MSRARPAAVPEAQLERLAPGSFAIRGAMTFGTARRLCAEGLRQLEADGSATMVIDCSGVTSADSGGLAVITYWLGWARSTGRRLSYRAVPDALQGLARISELDELLATGV